MDEPVEDKNCVVKNCKYKKLHSLREKINEDYRDYLMKAKIVSDIKDVVSKNADATIRLSLDKRHFEYSGRTR